MCFPAQFQSHKYLLRDPTDRAPWKCTLLTSVLSEPREHRKDQQVASALRSPDHFECGPQSRPQELELLETPLTTFMGGFIVSEVPPSPLDSREGQELVNLTTVHLGVTIHPSTLSHFRVGL